jgi:hypothetical protein
MSTNPEVVNVHVEPLGQVNPNVPPLTEKENTFHTPANAFSADDKELEVERIKSIDTEHHDDFSIDPFRPFNVGSCTRHHHRLAK